MENPDPLDARIGKHMADLRNRKGRSQATVAEKLGVQQATVSRWEHGRGTTLSTLKRYAAAIGVPLGDLLAPALEGERPPMTEQQRQLAETLMAALQEDR